MAKFDTDGKHLYIDGKNVLHGWESFSGWYWFATDESMSAMRVRAMRGQGEGDEGTGQDN